ETVETTRDDANRADGIELTELDLEPVPETTRLRDAMNGAERHMKHETANGKFDIDLPQAAQGSSDHRPRKPIDPALRERFGSYAPQAEAELATYRDLDEEAYNEPDAEIEPAANGNAMPADAARLDEECSTDIIVPFPAPRSSAKGHVKECLADGITTTIETLQQQPAEPDNAPATIGIELRRETATFHVPISQASLPDALTSLAEKIRVRGQVVSEQPQLELTLPAPTQASNGAQSTDPTVDGLNFVDEPAEFEPPLILRKTME
ncbi:MAG: hypothetical protein V3R26_07875, partial [Hyphomicrobium sp.]